MQEQLSKRTTAAELTEIPREIFTTTDYFLFKSIEGNRTKSLKHISDLKRSIKKDGYIFTIIYVNEKREIIDGQHRYEVIKELKLPMHYVVCPGYGLTEVHILNQTSKTWNCVDYLEGYCNLGFPDYLRFREFLKTYKMGFREAMYLLSGNSNSQATTVFYEGNFKIKSWIEACHVADTIKQIGQIYPGYRRRSFVFAVAQLLRNPFFKFDDFLSKLRRQPTSLVDCTTCGNYVSLIESIYNYGRRNKVSLKYNNQLAEVE